MLAQSVRTTLLQMENRFAEELYSERLQLSKLELAPDANVQQNNLNGKNLFG